MPRKSLFAAFLLLLSLACPDAVFAAQKLLITDSLDYTPLGHYFDLLEDPGGKLGVAEVAGGDMEDKFTPGKSDIYSMGFTTSVYWLRMDIENGANETKDAVIEMPVAWFDNLKMFLPAAGGGYHILQSGDRIPFYQRSFPHRDHLFRFTMRPGERQTIYIRAEAEDAMVLPFYFWTAEAYHRHDGRINMVFGTLYGMLVALMVYNLFVYYSVKDKSYLYYVLYIFGWLIFLFSTNGSAFEMLWPNMPYWGNRAPLFGAVVANLFAGLFTREFLNIRQTIPKYDRAVKAGIGFCIFMVPFSVLWPAYRHTDMLGTTTLTMIFGPVLFAGAILCYRKGVRQARFYLLAWLFPMLAMMIFGLGCFNILPFNFLTTHAIDFGASLEALLLSLALADKISIMREENEMAEERVRETLRRANEELEGKVLERTALLTVAKETAEKATRMKDQFVSLVSHDLRGPISSIKGLMSLSLNEGRSAGELRELAFKCHRASGALIEMIEKLLDISRLQTGSITLKKNFFDAALTVRDILERVGQLVESKGIRLIDEMPEGRALYADKTLFGEVVLNLLTNAIKFTPKGGSITIGMPEETAIAVTDTGGGIPEKMRADIFRHEVKTSMQGTEGEKGTGLGL
ncbi:MAG: sensor histidine kinase, partial [Nitrospinae bacterium]|nr:sensor histidine kinase [Nitrospinota bacterium]